MNSKTIIQKLFKIAENQQKVITKLAQMVDPAQPMGGSTLSWDDVSTAVGAVLKAVPSAAGYAVNKAEVDPANGSVRAVLIIPKGDTKYYDVVKFMKSQLAGTSLTTNDGKIVQVTKDPSNMNFTAIT